MSKSLKSQVQKFRPVLTASQIAQILNLAKSEKPLTSASLSLISTLAPFMAKIENAGITAAYTLAEPKPDLLFSLGAVSSASSNNQSNLQTKEETWEEAYHKYTSNPASCSLQEIRDAKEHAYLNDLMTKEEEEAFENGEY
jgi:hypothetical protein